MPPGATANAARGSWSSSSPSAGVLSAAAFFGRLPVGEVGAEVDAVGAGEELREEGAARRDLLFLLDPLELGSAAGSTASALRFFGGDGATVGAAGGAGEGAAGAGGSASGWGVPAVSESVPIFVTCFCFGLY